MDEETRKFIAAMCLQGLLANPNLDWVNVTYERAAIEAVNYADALLKALEKEDD